MRKKRDRTTELRTAQKNLLRLSGFKWRRANEAWAPECWIITKPRRRIRDDAQVIVSCTASIEVTQSTIDHWRSLYE